MKRDNNFETKIYLKYLLAGYLFIGGVATFQNLLAYGDIKFQFYLIPFVVATIIGLLLGHSAVLKARLRKKTQQFRAIADMATEFTYYRNLNHEYEYVSPACLRFTGYDQRDFYQQPHLMTRLIHPDDLELWKNHIHEINAGAEPQTMDLRLITKDLQEIWISHMCTGVFGADGKQIGVRSTNLDITERKTYEQRFQRMAYYDSLTELPNRRSLEVELSNTISQSSERDSFALLFLDLSRFKNINDNFGHTFGDRLLFEIARRLDSLSDELFVSRFGGDEFVLIARNVVKDEQAMALARRIIKLIETPIDIDSVELYVSGSVGIAFYPRDGGDAESLISRADAAMYKTKVGISLGPEIYSASLGNQVKHFVTTEQKIHKALTNDEFDIFYQPKVKIDTGEIIGLEALLRWLHPIEGVVLPGEFIHIVEETGQINEIGQIVFSRVVNDLERWTEKGIAVPVAINLSARQFSSQLYCDSCIENINNLPFPASMLELEVTEQVFLGDIERAIARIEVFRELGVGIALDDFGTGYSSLNYLKRLPLDTLKIDISFIRDIRLGNRPYSILKAILTMAQVIGLKAIAEGVETIEQRDLLIDLECRYAQGYLYHHPMPREEAELLLVNQQAKSTHTA